MNPLVIRGLPILYDLLIHSLPRQLPKTSVASYDATHKFDLFFIFMKMITQHLQSDNVIIEKAACLAINDTLLCMAQNKYSGVTNSIQRPDSSERIQFIVIVEKLFQHFLKGFFLQSSFLL
jgi:hypothetical protein